MHCAGVGRARKTWLHRTSRCGLHSSESFASGASKAAGQRRRRRRQRGLGGPLAVEHKLVVLARAWIAGLRQDVLRQQPVESVRLAVHHPWPASVPQIDARGASGPRPHQHKRICGDITCVSHRCNKSCTFESLNAQHISSNCFSWSLNVPKPPTTSRLPPAGSAPVT